MNIGDRESDIYELFELAFHEGSKAALLVRAQYNRKVDHPQKTLWNFLRSQAVSGTQGVDVPRKAGRKARSATLSIRFGEVRLQPACGKKEKKSFGVWAVMAEEINPPSGVEPIVWRLLTTRSVADFKQAVEKIRWYALRWQIELFHKALKSGWRIEDRQLETVDRLKRVLTLDLIVAWRIFYMTKLGRQIPSRSATEILAPHEWKALYGFVHQQTPPDEPPTLHDAITRIARLGGFLARKGDGFPGSICLWRGLNRLTDIAATWLLFHSIKDVRNA